MTKSKSVRIGVAAAAIVLMCAATSRAWMGHENRLTFSQPVSLPGVTLPAGTYSFDIADSSSNLDIVVVRNAARTKTYFQGFTALVPRPSGMPANAVVTFGEQPANSPMPITAWYPIGQQVGHQFLYR